MLHCWHQKIHSIQHHSNVKYSSQPSRPTHSKTNHKHMAKFTLSNPGPSAVASSAACPDGGQLSTPTSWWRPAAQNASSAAWAAVSQLLTYAQYWTLAPAACNTATTSMYVLAWAQALALLPSWSGMVDMSFKPNFRVKTKIKVLLYYYSISQIYSDNSTHKWNG